ncbi:MAG: cytochrome c oxidase assembly protein [Thermodesulfobacteriales bacterium]|jgi:putative membrane protein|nr:MAG: cytochrome c oxidase assembly protein [Thermodesulfobacteriales bacterium]
MNIWQVLSSTWNMEPWVLVSALAVLVAYGLGTGFKFTKLSALFITGITIYVLALVSPLDYLGRTYLFSANMIQHILLLLVVPLLLLLGIPKTLAEKALAIEPIGAVMKVLGNPIVAWFLGVGSMWVWHLPSLHESVLANDNLYITQQISFVLIGMIFWWPVFAPVESRRLSPLVSTLYLSSACLGCTILGMLITFAGAGLYASYMTPVDTIGILPLLRGELCLTPGVDQQIGGLTMWVPGCLIYLAASMVTIARWYGAPEDYEISSNSGAEGLLTATQENK